jgi:hypothetical protein
MDFRSSNTIDTVVYTGPTITGLGAQLLRYEILDGIPIEGPLTRESGPILLANKSYIIGIFNNDIVGLTVQYNWFLREV